MNHSAEKADGRPPAPALEPSLIEALYDSLRGAARQMLGSTRDKPLLQTTVVVHEAWLRLQRTAEDRFESRRAYFAAASRIMRSVLVDEARREAALRRGRGWRRVPLSAADETEGASAIDLLDLDHALTELASINPRWVRVVEHRFFAGLSVHETADALGISERLVELDWRGARAWLRARLENEEA